MKLFKNKVGRPSNKIKKQRKILLISVISLCVLLFCTMLTLIVKVDNMKAALGFVSPYVSITGDTFSNKIPKGDVANLNIKLRYYGKQNYYFKVVGHVGKSYEASSCQKFPAGSKKITYPLKVSEDNTYVSIELYNNSSCTKLYRTVTGPKYVLSDKVSNNKSKTFIATFYKNEADSIGAEKLSCTTKTSSCTIKAPSIKKDGYIINGWAISSLSLAKYKPGDTITLKKDMKFYAKTTKKMKSTIISNVVDIINSASNSINKSKISMTKYTSSWNIGSSGVVEVTTSKKDDTVTLTSSNSLVMRLDKKSNNSWKMTAIDSGTVTITATSSSGASISTTYTVKPYEYLGTSRMKNGCKSKIVLNGVTIYRENGVSDSIYNGYLADFKEVPSYMKRGVKELYILTSSTYLLYYNKGSIAMTSTRQGSAVIDIKADKYDGTRYVALAHEIAHSIDFRYNHVYGTGRISANKNWSNLYNYYKNNQSKALRSYAYNNKGEFFAESYGFFFMKYQAKTHTFSKSSYSKMPYPNDLKNEMSNTLNFINNTKL